MYVYPYKTASKSARALAEALNYTLAGYDGNLLRAKSTIKVVNWGAGELPAPYRDCRVLNKSSAIMLAVNKLRTFEALKRANVPTPAWTTRKADAQAWLAQGKVIGRTTLEGKDGDGIVVLDGTTKTDWFGRPLPLPDFPLYTKFIRARAEYRINVCGNETMGVQLKVPDGTKTITSSDIKTGGNGYGFRLLAENEIPTGIRPVARAAITALGLDFGGVDLIVGVDGNPYVLEVNTAPELTPSMVTRFANKLAGM